jgi:hypothetical protein
LLPSASKRWIVALGSGSTPRLPEEPTPTQSTPLFGSIAGWRFWCPWTMPKTPFGQHFGTIGTGRRFALVRRHRAAGAHRADDL